MQPIQGKKGARHFNFLDVNFVPNEVPMADHTLESIGCLASDGKHVLEDWVMLYQVVLNQDTFEPLNGVSAAAWVARTRIAVPCGRVLRVK